MNKAAEQISYRKIITTAVVTMLVMVILLYIPSPLVVIEPGIAISTKPIVQIPHEEAANTVVDPAGEFILTAVRLETPNLWSSLLSLFKPHHSVLLRSDVLGNDSVEQYMQRSTLVMKGSHDDALEAAYRYLHIAYEIQPQALYITDVSLGKRQSDFRAGDQIMGLSHGPTLYSVEQLMEEIAKNDHPDKLSIEVKSNDGSKRSIELQLTEGWQDAKDPTMKLASILGVTGFTELKAIVAGDSQFKLTVDSKSIGGPSAGLVLTLTMIDALTDGDLTNGQIIAVTGSIDAEGKVGAIGGISQKVYITSKRGAKLFIVPKANEAEAKSKAKRLRTSMNIVGVSSLSEALEVISSYE